MANVFVKLCEKITAKRITNLFQRKENLPIKVGSARNLTGTISNSESLLINDHLQIGLQDDQEAFCLPLYRQDDETSNLCDPGTLHSVNACWIQHGPG